MAPKATSIGQASPQARVARSATRPDECISIHRSRETRRVSNVRAHLSRRSNSPDCLFGFNGFEGFYKILYHRFSFLYTSLCSQMNLRLIFTSTTSSFTGLGSIKEKWGKRKNPVGLLVRKPLTNHCTNKFLYYTKARTSVFFFGRIFCAGFRSAKKNMPVNKKPPFSLLENSNTKHCTNQLKYYTKARTNLLISASEAYFLPVSV